MKQLIQIIALNLLGLNALQMIVAIGSAILLLQVAGNKFSAVQKRWKIKKRNREMESNMWSIE